MARKNPVPAREKKIGKRLRQFRDDEWKLTRVAFAAECGIDSGRLASYEAGRVPLTYEIAWRVVNIFGMSAEWLATGEGDLFSRRPLPRPDKLSVSQNALFSDVYDRISADLKSSKLNEPPDILERRAMFEMALYGFAEKWSKRVPDSKISHFLICIGSLDNEVEDNYPKDPDNVVVERQAKLDRSLSVHARSRLFRHPMFTG
jgi:transcriptional regulator with XRE-family HTH domain